MGRNILVFSTQNDRKVTISSNATQWGELRDALESEFKFDISKMNCVAKNSQGKTKLDFDETPLPAGEFNLFLMPKEVKSGAFDMAGALDDLRSKINSAFEEVIESIDAGEYGIAESSEDEKLKQCAREIQNELKSN
jgi:hypothetical protein